MSAWAVAPSDSKASSLYEDALTRYEKKDYQGAIVQLKNALQLDKTMLPVHVLLGRALSAKGDVAAAEVEFNESLSLGVNRAEVVLPLARSIADQGRPSELIDQPRFQTDGLPSDVQAQLLLIKSKAYQDLGNPSQALQAIAAARAADPSLIDGWLAEVPVRIRARQFAEAMAAVDKAAAMDPQSADMFYGRGSILHAQGDLKAALAQYDKALAANPDLNDARVARAGLDIDLRLYDDAAKDVADLLQRSPLEPRGWYLSALLAERQGRPADVKAALLQITGLLDPVPLGWIRFRPQMLMLAGQAHYALGEREKAKAYLEYFQQAQPVTPVSKMLATIYMSEKNYDAAIDALDRYSRASPNDTQALALLAAAQMAKGRDGTASALMQQALRTSDAPALHAAYGMSLLGSGQAADGQAELEVAFAKDPSQTQAGFTLGTLYLRQHQTAKAIAVASSMASRQPASAVLQDLLGQAKAQGRDFAGARAAFTQAIKLGPSLTQPSLDLARLEIDQNNLDKAQTILNGLLQAHDKDTETLYQLAVLAERRRRPDEALRWLQKALDLGGADLRPGLALVDLRMRLNQPDEALKTALIVASRAPEDLRALVALARAQLANGDQTGARASLTKATRVAGYDAPAQVEVALLQLLANDLSGAAYCLDKALSSQPDNLRALALKSEVDWRQGDFPNAEKTAQQIIGKAPKLAIGYSLMGDISLARKQPDAAVESYRKAYQVQPSGETMTRLFRLLANRDIGAARQLARQWTQAHPKDLGGARLLAEADARSGDLASARRNYERILQAVPNDPGLLNDYANVLLGLKDPQALAVAERALKAAPTSFITIDTAGWSNYISGNTDRAVELLRDARLRNPQSGEIRYHLAAALARMGRKGEARTELQAALRDDRGFGERGQAEALLHTLE